MENITFTEMIQISYMYFFFFLMQMLTIEFYLETKTMRKCHRKVFFPVENKKIVFAPVRESALGHARKEKGCMNEQPRRAFMCVFII